MLDERDSQHQADVGGLVIFCVIGLPRSGSTFIGDWIARETNGINAGETWQTFRTSGLISDPRFERRAWKWVSGRGREQKAAQIVADPFWSKVMADAGSNPYRALTNIAKEDSGVLVDCSKVDKPLDAYISLGYEVRIVHSVRPFTTWSQSIRKYEIQHGRRPQLALRLLLSYIRVNRALGKWRSYKSYQVIRHEDIKLISSRLNLDVKHGKKYFRAEMFGTPSFSGEYNAARASVRVSKLDLILYFLAGIPSTVHGLRKGGAG